MFGCLIGSEATTRASRSVEDPAGELSNFRTLLFQKTFFLVGGLVVPSDAELFGPMINRISIYTS